MLKGAVLTRKAAWRIVVQAAVGLGIPMMALSASRALFDAYRSATLPADLRQAPATYLVHIPTGESTEQAYFTPNGRGKLLSPAIEILYGFG